jgi:hypothetical protein
MSFKAFRQLCVNTYESLHKVCHNTYESIRKLCSDTYKSLRKICLEKYESLRQLGFKKYLPYYDVRTPEEYDQEIADAEHRVESCSINEHESFRKHSKLVSRRICRISFDGDEFSIESRPK